MKTGDPVTVIGGGGKVHGRVLRENESGSQQWIVTPGGSVLRSGIAWVRTSDRDDLIDLRRYEHLAANPYGGKLDRALWASGDDDS